MKRLYLPLLLGLTVYMGMVGAIMYWTIPFLASRLGTNSALPICLAALLLLAPLMLWQRRQLEVKGKRLPWWATVAMVLVWVAAIALGRSRAVSGGVNDFERLGVTVAIVSIMFAAVFWAWIRYEEEHVWVTNGGFNADLAPMGPPALTGG